MDEWGLDKEGSSRLCPLPGVDDHLRILGRDVAGSGLHFGKHSDVCLNLTRMGDRRKECRGETQVSGGNGAEEVRQ